MGAPLHYHSALLHYQIFQLQGVCYLLNEICMFKAWYTSHFWNIHEKPERLLGAPLHYRFEDFYRRFSCYNMGHLSNYFSLNGENVKRTIAERFSYGR